MDITGRTVLVTGGRVGGGARRPMVVRHAGGRPGRLDRDLGERSRPSWDGPVRAHRRHRQASVARRAAAAGTAAGARGPSLAGSPRPNGAGSGGPALAGPVRTVVQSPWSHFNFTRLAAEPWPPTTLVPTASVVSSTPPRCRLLRPMSRSLRRSKAAWPGRPSRRPRAAPTASRACRRPGISQPHAGAMPDPVLPPSGPVTVPSPSATPGILRPVRPIIANPCSTARSSAGRRHPHAPR